LFPSAVVKDYRIGQDIIHEGEPSAWLHLVCRGLVLVTALSEGGKESVLHVVGCGGIADIRDCFSSSDIHAVSARALTDTTILFIRHDELHKRLEAAPFPAMKLLGQIATQLQMLEERYAERESEDAHRRVVRTLLRLVRLSEKGSAAMPAGRQAEVVLPFPLGRPLLSQLAGTSPETISRVMARLRKLGVVRQARHEVRIPDVRRLHEIRNRERS
jgi:CRP-like cAMP-binding protein